MSHEIRTPLNGIIGMTDLALDTDITTEQREYLDTVKLSADSLLTVINDILDFSKVEAGKLELEFTDFDLRDCLETTLKTLALRADEKNLELLCEISPDAPEFVRGDSNRLRQIVVNLVGNAIKFTHHGQVQLEVVPESQINGNHCLHFTVSDTGIGISPETQSVIFQPFAQADTSTTRKYGGTGLGLTISTRLINLMGGRIWLESELGVGSRFHFTMVFAPSTGTVKAHSAASLEALRGANVLVVDDNSTNLRILRDMVSRWDMQPFLADSGEQALAMLQNSRAGSHAFPVLIVDMHMTRMDGFTLIERVRKDFSTSCKIVVLTSAGHRGDTQRCQELNVSAYLLKPIRQSELCETLATVLNPQAQQALPPPNKRASPHANLSPHPLSVLVAEDNAVNQRLIVRMLEKRGHRVKLASQGREALELLETESFDLVLMDIQMPEVDGLTATMRIRELEKARGSIRRQPIIALTAHAMKGDQERFLAAGMDGYLSKPIRPYELDEILAGYLNSPETPSEDLVSSEPHPSPR